MHSSGHHRLLHAAEDGEDTSQVNVQTGQCGLTGTVSPTRGNQKWLPARVNIVNKDKETPAMRTLGRKGNNKYSRQRDSLDKGMGRGKLGGF